jgi:GTPase involved in cell partitioning and DNA repair
MMTDEQQEALLADLTELSRKHGIKIGGCGCCGSPYFTEMDRNMPGRYQGGIGGALEWEED